MPLPPLPVAAMSSLPFVFQDWLRQLRIVVTDGVYTPTYVNIANAPTIGAYECIYTRIGKVVSVSGRVDITPTTTGINTEVAFDLPIRSALASLGSVTGVVADPNLQSNCGAIFADVVNQRALLRYITAANVYQALFFTFSYSIT